MPNIPHLVQRSGVARCRCLHILGLPVALLSAALLLTPGISLADGMLELAELVSRPAQYDQQPVAVTGWVGDVQVAKNRRGQKIYGFLLSEGDSVVKVLGIGRAPVREGQHIMVEGVFRRHRRAGRAPGYNQIKASLIRPLDRLHPDLIG